MDTKLKLLTYLNTAILVVLLLSNFAPVHKTLFGAVSTATTFNDLNLDSTNGIGGAQLYQNSNLVIASGTRGAVITADTLNASTSITWGGGTAVTKIQCATTSQNVASTIINATTTFDIALTGVSTSSNQAFWIGNATTTAGTKMLSYTVNPTSTAGFATVTLRPLGGTYVGQSVFTVCYAQF